MGDEPDQADPVSNRTPRPRRVPAAELAQYPTGGRMYAWFTGDPLPQIAPIEGLRVSEECDDALLARLVRVPVEEIVRRRSVKSVPYVARINEELVGYGWSAREQGEIGDLHITFTLAPDDRYLWDFATLPEWRGRGIYPHVLQAIVRQESPPASRFWIGHEENNLASGRGISKAGFILVGRGVMLPGPRFGMIPESAPARWAPLASTLGLADILVPD